MKYILVLALISFTVTNDVLISHRQLSYDDFRGEPAPGAFTAETYTRIEFGHVSVQNRYIFKAYAYFLPKRSYMKVRNEKILQHEQLHFDITEIFARKIETSTRWAYDKKGIDRAYEIHDSLIVEWNKFQQLYDKETQNSINDSTQQVWNERIKNMLKNYQQ